MKISKLEPTPNPNAFKFIVEEELSKRSRYFNDAASATDDPLASSLFEVEGIESIFYMDQFVTVTKTEEADWEAVMTESGQRIIDFDVATLPDEEEGAEGATAEMDEETAGILVKVNAVIDEMVRPALAGDGGGLEILGLENNTLFIRYQGACGTCPSAVTGTLTAIERLVQHQVDPNLTVLPA